MSPFRAIAADFKMSHFIHNKKCVILVDYNSEKLFYTDFRYNTVDPIQAKKSLKVFFHIIL
jgi:hypothetical protein